MRVLTYLRVCGLVDVLDVLCGCHKVFQDSRIWSSGGGGGSTFRNLDASLILGCFGRFRVCGSWVFELRKIHPRFVIKVLQGIHITDALGPKP